MREEVIFFMFYVVFASAYLCEDGTIRNSMRKKWCSSERVYRMKGANCYDRDFTKFPQCLRSDIEVLDLSYNRLRSIRKQDLEKYTSLKILYLSDNMISRIDDDAFEDNDLTFLDLSLNSLLKVPSQIFHLPSLEQLLLSKNLNMNVVEAVESAKPISSPLKVLDISYNELDELPDLGIMPYLIKYNISGNDANMSVRSLAGLCSLKQFVNNDSTLNFENPCDCWILQNWLKERGVRFTPFDCYEETNVDECTLVVSPADMALYQECKESIESVRLKSQMVKILVTIAIILLAVAAIVGYILWKRKQRRNRKLKGSIMETKMNGRMLT